MAARKRTTAGLESLGNQDDPALLSVTDIPPSPVPPLDLDVARLLLVLPQLEGNPNTVAEATLLRARCLGEVMCLTLTAWERATPEDRASGATERKLLAKWREWVGALAVPTDAAWWLEHGRSGPGGAIHPALALAEARKRQSA